jgi:hypothetical protein
MLVIPITAVASQTRQFVVGGQNCQMSIYTNDGFDYSDPTLSIPKQYIAIDFAYNGIQVTNTQNCVNLARLLKNRQYLGFIGDFMFVDTEDDQDPQYTGLGTRWVLLYLEAADLA